MRIIGIYLREGSPSVIKNLASGWYPFGGYQEPTDENPFPWSGTFDDERVLSKMYKDAANDSFSPTFNISVSCIVGKNGAGKSTLLELMFRIINDFAFYALNRNQVEDIPTGRRLSEAGGFDASLYFETDGYFGEVKYTYGNIGYRYLSGNKTSNVRRIDEMNELLDKGKLKHVLSGFFYTVCSNYSIYSFNQFDYSSKRITEPEGEINVDGSWIGGLLHKNDGYLAPLVITPYRDIYGNTDIDNEKDLAKQRLSVFALLFLSQKKSFLGKYKASYFEYRFDENAATSFQNKFLKLCQERIPLNSHADLLSGFTNEWQRVLSQIKPEIINYNDKVFTSLITYLAYKSLKICVNYRSFGKLLGQRALNEEEKVDARTRWETDILRRSKWHNDLLQYMSVLELYPECYQAVVEKILREDTHITLKVQQMLTFINYGLLNATYAPKGSPEYLTGTHKLSAEKYLQDCLLKYNETVDEAEKKHSYKTYDEVFRILPPSIFEWELYYAKDGEPVDNQLTKGISLNSFSSGEKQLLYSLSYLVYHIKNIESIITDKYRFRYHHINVVMDEAELYYHPDFQRELLYKAIRLLGSCHIDARKIRSINFIMVTHSPFVLSDVPKCRILYLENGERKGNQEETFSTNIHELLYNHFYITKPMGEVASKAIQKIVDFFNDRKSLDKKDIKSFVDQLPYYRKIVEYIGEPYLKGTLSSILTTIETEYEGPRQRLVTMHEELNFLNKKIAALTEKIHNEENKLQ